jgi:RNA polymerase sigma-32 factor
MTDGSDSSFIDFLVDTKATPEDRIMESQRASFVKGQIDIALEKLSPREQDITRQRLMAENPLTLEDLGRQYAISKERVRQIENNVKAKLKKALAGHLDLMLP